MQLLCMSFSEVLGHVISSGPMQRLLSMGHCTETLECVQVDFLRNESSALPPRFFFFFNVLFGR